MPRVAPAPAEEPPTPAPPAPEEDERPWDEATAEEMAAHEAAETIDESDAPLDVLPEKKPLRIESVDTADLDAEVGKLAPSTRELLEARFRARFLGTREADPDDVY